MLRCYVNTLSVFVCDLAILTRTYFALFLFKNEMVGNAERLAYENDPISFHYSLYV